MDICICKYCGEILKGKSSIRQHEMRHEQKGRYTCQKCPKVFFSRANFERHLSTHQIRPRKTFSCECGASFLTSCELLRHKRREENRPKFTCSICKKTFETKKDKDDHEGCHATLASKTNICKVCFKSFRFRRGLSRHMKIHKNEKYSCEFCNKEFSSAEKLHNHKERMHDIKNYRCKICQKLFKSKEYVKRHLSRFHLK